MKEFIKNNWVGICFFAFGVMLSVWIGIVLHEFFAYQYHEAGASHPALLAKEVEATSAGKSEMIDDATVCAINSHHKMVVLNGHVYWVEIPNECSPDGSVLEEDVEGVDSCVSVSKEEVMSLVR